MDYPEEMEHSGTPIFPPELEVVEGAIFTFPGESRETNAQISSTLYLSEFGQEGTFDAILYLKHMTAFPYTINVDFECPPPAPPTSPVATPPPTPPRTPPRRVRPARPVPLPAPPPVPPQALIPRPPSPLEDFLADRLSNNIKLILQVSGMYGLYHFLRLIDIVALIGWFLVLDHIGDQFGPAFVGYFGQFIGGEDARQWDMRRFREREVMTVYAIGICFLIWMILKKTGFGDEAEAIEEIQAGLLNQTLSDAV
ncbi:hypothetical protein ABW19_dt0203212 [Dactylella cylindrospora]|nr:hypothetical protein ABW19_dt0203212 [Dactylella cylindrospora]